MKIAFDVNGTLIGSKGHLLLELLKTLSIQGHECIVWSNDLSTASNFIKENNLNVNFMKKISKIDCIKQKLFVFDIAFEDDFESTYYLASNKFVLVNTLPDNLHQILQMYFSE